MPAAVEKNEPDNWGYKLLRQTEKGVRTGFSSDRSWIVVVHHPDTKL